MLRDDPVAGAITALLTDEVEAKLTTALAADGIGFDRARLTEVHSVHRLYGSTAGPFGGIGGAAMTTFRLTVVCSPELAVLFAGGRLYGFARTADVDLDVIEPDQFRWIL